MKWTKEDYTKLIPEAVGLIYDNPELSEREALFQASKNAKVGRSMPMPLQPPKWVVSLIRKELLNLMSVSGGPLFDSLPTSVQPSTTDEVSETKAVLQELSLLREETRKLSRLNQLFGLYSKIEEIGKVTKNPGQISVCLVLNESVPFGRILAWKKLLPQNVKINIFDESKLPTETVFLTYLAQLNYNLVIRPSQIYKSNKKSIFMLYDSWPTLEGHLLSVLHLAKSAFEVA